MAEPSAVLNNGVRMPLLAFGTLIGGLKPDFDLTLKLIKDAIDTGYRHLDTAQVYNTEHIVGEAIKQKIADGTVTRQDLFVTTKLWRNGHARDAVVPSLKGSLQRLGLESVDLFLIHWPTAFVTGENMWPKDDQGNFIYADIDPLDTWRGMEECVDLGLAKFIGISNFNSQQTQRILDNARIKPVNNQVESHPHLTNTQLIKYCQDRGIVMTAYSPLGGQFKVKADVLGDPVIQGIAKKHSRTAAQVAIRYQLDRNCSVAPKSDKQNRMVENFQSLDFKLDDSDIEAINGCNKNLRVNVEFPDHPHFPFNIEF